MTRDEFLEMVAPAALPIQDDSRFGSESFGLRCRCGWGGCRSTREAAQKAVHRHNTVGQCWSKAAKIVVFAKREKKS